MNARQNAISKLKLEFPDSSIRGLARRAFTTFPELFRTEASAYGCTRILMAKASRPEPKVAQGPPAREGTSFEKSGEIGLLTSCTRNIKTVEQLLAYTKVDLTEWEVDRFIVNKWETAGKDAKGRMITVPLFQIKVWLKHKTQELRQKRFLVELLQEFKKASPALAAPSRKPLSDGHLLEMSVFDIHLGKLCWGDETGENYDTKISADLFRTAIDELMDQTAGFQIERILFPVGNDFFNVDNAARTTTAGTPQDEDGRWQKTFVAGRKAMVDAIMRLRELAPVDVVMVSGNHDTERLFYLGDVLEGWFRNVPDVKVNNSPMLRKYYHYGECLIGLTHGKEEKMTNLPLIMATEQPKLWAKSRFREFHVGHWHHKKEIHFENVIELNEIRVRVIPSLCPADAWHKKKGHSGLRAAEAFIWNKHSGCVATMTYSPPVAEKH